MPDDRITREEISGPDWVGLVTGTYIPALLMHMSELEKRLELIRGIREQDSVQKLYRNTFPQAGDVCDYSSAPQSYNYINVAANRIKVVFQSIIKEFEGQDWERIDLHAFLELLNNKLTSSETKNSEGRRNTLNHSYNNIQKCLRFIQYICSYNEKVLDAKVINLFIILNVGDFRKKAINEYTKSLNEQ